MHLNTALQYGLSDKYKKKGFRTVKDLNDLYIFEKSHVKEPTTHSFHCLRINICLHNDIVVKIGVVVLHYFPYFEIVSLL